MWQCSKAASFSKQQSYFIQATPTIFLCLWLISKCTKGNVEEEIKDKEDSAPPLKKLTKEKDMLCKCWKQVNV